MSSLLPFVIATLPLAVTIPISVASAEPIVITGGTVAITGLSSGATGNLQGTQQFTANPVIFGTVAGLGCFPCGPPGSTINLDVRMDTVDGGGTITHGGASFAVGSIGGFPNTAVLVLSFAAPTLIAPPMSTRATLSAPFDLSRSFLYAWNESGEGGPVPIVGRGTATLELVPNRFEDDLWEFGSLRYDFRPVPEPATLMLVGSGLLAAGASRLRRRRDRPLPQGVTPARS